MRYSRRLKNFVDGCWIEPCFEMKKNTCKDFKAVKDFEKEHSTVNFELRNSNSNSLTKNSKIFENSVCS